MAKSMPRAGRPHKTPGSKRAPVKRGVTQGSARDRAKLDVDYNPLGAVNGPAGGTGRPAPKPRPPASKPLPKQGGTGS
jgi:hypothetical protein